MSTKGMRGRWKRPDLTETNLRDNPAKRPEVRAKISASRKGQQNSLGRRLSPEARRKIAKALTGRKQSPKMIAKRVASWRRTAAKHGGMTPAHREQLASIQKSGPEHPGWKGGLTPERQKDYQSPEYLAFVNAVLERDEYTCQSCGARNGLGQDIGLQAHHKLSYAEHPELRYHADNGVTLCIDCHNATKRGIPRPNRKDFVPKERICEICDQSYRVRNPRKYCPNCRATHCCPVCGSTICHHARRRLERVPLP